MVYLERHFPPGTHPRKEIPFELGGHFKLGISVFSPTGFSIISFQQRQGMKEVHSRILADEVQLRVENIQISFGGVNALRGVSLEVRKGEIFSLIGPNGAGKTVCLNCINGLYRPQQGELHFEKQEISRLKPYQRARAGIARSFQKIELFKGMTVLDNIRLGRHIHMKTNLLEGAFYFGRTARQEIEHREFIEREIIDLLEIEAIRDKVVGMLPYGLQKRVDLARALVTFPMTPRSGSLSFWLSSSSWRIPTTSR